MRPLVVGLVSLFAISTLAGCPAALEDPERFVTSERSATTATCDAPAVFTAHCTTCHGGANPMMDLALDSDPSLAALRGKTAKGGPGLLIDPAAPERSVIYLKVTSPPFGSAMPPSGKLDPKDLECVRTWLERVAPADNGAGGI